MPVRLLQGRQGYISKQINILRAKERLRPERLLSSALSYAECLGRKGRKLSLIGSKIAYSGRKRNTSESQQVIDSKAQEEKPKEDVWDSYKAGSLET